MKTDDTVAVFLCNGATPPDGLKRATYTVLDYQTSGSEPPIVRLRLPAFVRSVNYLPDRCLDLLEIAAYVFAADRLTPRGSREAVEYQSWSRSLHFIVKVRDHEFWSQPTVCEALEVALRFGTGDQGYRVHVSSWSCHSTDEPYLTEQTSRWSIMAISPSCFSPVGLIPLPVPSNDLSRPVNTFA